MNELIDFFKILSDETRLRIIVLLHEKALCVCELCEILNLSQPKVSRHLARLRDSGLVIDERREQWVFYSLNISNALMGAIVAGIVAKRFTFPGLVGDLAELTKKEKAATMCARKK